MKFELSKTIEILAKTPIILKEQLEGISEEWIHNNEGDGTWSPYDVIGHLIHGEKTDWIPRTEIILAQGENKTFSPFDRFAQMGSGVNKSIEELLEEFQSLRKKNLRSIGEMEIEADQLSLKGMHPEFGPVTLQQLLATWLVHDLNHLSQITRVLAKQYKSEVGPWKAYLRLLNE